MNGGNTELAMMALVIIVMIMIFAIVWFVFMLPMERGLHERRMDLIRKKLQDKEERLQRQRREAPDDVTSGERSDDSRCG